MNKVSSLRKRKLFVFTVSFFVILSIWWLAIYFRGLKEGVENNIFTNVYPWVSLWGGIAGLVIARQWGGYKSILGRAFGAFSLGLLGQAFGQVCYAYYIWVLKVDIPYPSIGDIGFFSTGIFYAYGAIQLMRASGVQFSFKTYKGRIVAIIIPVIWALSTYFFFLKGYEFDWKQPLVIILDLVSPIIDGVYLSLAILTYLLSRKILGGIMRAPVLFLLLAIMAQAISDYTFIYQVSRNTIYYAGVNDYMYLVSFTLMALALMYLGISFNRLNEE
jgi:hypothetical protein